MIWGRIALYMFTHVLQVNMCFLYVHTNFTLLHMSGLAVGQIHYLLKHHSSGTALSLLPTALVTILATDS